MKQMLAACWVCSGLGAWHHSTAPVRLTDGQWPSSAAEKLAEGNRQHKPDQRGRYTRDILAGIG